MGKRTYNGDFSFLPLSLVSNVKDQSKLPNSLLVGGQCLEKVIFCRKPFDFDDFCLKLSKYLMFSKVWHEIKCYFCILAHISSNIKSILIK